MARQEFESELQALRQELLSMAGQVESQLHDAIDALQRRDPETAERVRSDDRRMNALFRSIGERCVLVIAKQQPVARDLRMLMGVIYISSELERMGDYAVRIARMTATLCDLPGEPLRPEFSVMADLANRQVHDILDALIEHDEQRAREIAAKDDEVDVVYHHLFDELVKEIAERHTPEDALRGVTLILVAHNLERIADRVTNVAEDVIFLESGRIEELG